MQKMVHRVQKDYYRVLFNVRSTNFLKKSSNLQRVSPIT